MATTKIKCPVEGIVDLDRLPTVAADAVRRVIDAPEMQRLRSIKQLGFSHLVYPGALHTRFAHSLGAFQGAQRTLAQLRAHGADIPDVWFAATALACLLHDLGHGPFSHTFESVSGQSHESWTASLIESGPVLPGVLEDLSPGMGAKVLQLIRGEVEVVELRYLTDLVSSALDCDRMDYLRRDALYTGAGYGAFDRDWLIRDLQHTADGAAIVVVEKGRSAVEQYLIGRYHMFQNVYLHKTSRGFETAFRGLCRRLSVLGLDAVPAGARAFRTLFSRPLSLDEHLRLKDASFEYEIAGLVDHADPSVRALARALHRRQPLRSFTIRGDDRELERLHVERKERAVAAGLDPDLAVWRDAAGDIPYQPYSPQEGRKGLRVITRAGDLVDITAVSPTIAALSQKIVVHRLYWVDC